MRIHRPVLFASSALIAVGLHTAAMAGPAVQGVDSTYPPPVWGNGYTINTHCEAPYTIDPTTLTCGQPVAASTVGTGTTGSGPSATDSAALIQADIVHLGSAGQQYIDDLFSYLVEQDQITTQSTNLQGDLAYAKGLRSDSVSEYALAQQAGQGSSAQAVLLENAQQDAVPLDYSTGVERNINDLISQGQQNVQSAETGLAQYETAVAADRQRITDSLAQELADAEASGNSSLLATVRQQQADYTTALASLAARMQTDQLSNTNTILAVQQDTIQIQTAIVAFRSTGNYGGAEQVSTALEADLAVQKEKAAQINEGALLASDKAQAVALSAQLQQAVGTASNTYVANVATYNTDVQTFNSALNTYNTTISNGGTVQQQTQAYQAVIAALVALNSAGTPLGINPISSGSIPKPATS